MSKGLTRYTVIVTKNPETGEVELTPTPLGLLGGLETTASLNMDELIPRLRGLSKRANETALEIAKAGETKEIGKQYEVLGEYLSKSVEEVMYGLPNGSVIELDVSVPIK